MAVAEASSSPAEIAELEAYGVRHIFSPADGQRLGLARMVNVLIEDCDIDLAADVPISLDGLMAGDPTALARVITALEGGSLPERQWLEIAANAAPHAPGTRDHGDGRFRQVLPDRRNGEEVPAGFR